MAGNKKIFIADDDADILHIMELMLHTRGYEVATSTTASEIFEYGKGELPDLILLDIWMSGVDGREICSKLKKNKLTRNIPIFFVSANSNIEEITEKFNADGFIPKPFEMEYFLEKIDSAVNSQ